MEDINIITYFGLYSPDPFFSGEEHAPPPTPHGLQPFNPLLFSHNSQTGPGGVGLELTIG